MAHPLQPTVFLDRDGVLNRAFVRDGVPHPPAHPGELELLPGVPEALERLRAAGFALVVVTNQPDVARGTQTRARVEEINQRLRATLPLLDVLTCFHDTADGCACRKPQPGLLLMAAQRWGLNLKRSFMVGDRWSDIAAGQAAGCTTFLIDAPYSQRERCTPDYVVADLVEAAHHIVRLLLLTRGEPI
jgi:D-glycero-D-manno-heptose 1,7-bisphosphate phosphatase